MQLPAASRSYSIIFIIAFALSVTIIYFSAAPILFNEIDVNHWNATAPIFFSSVDPLDSVDLVTFSLRTLFVQITPLDINSFEVIELGFFLIFEFVFFTGTFTPIQDCSETSGSATDGGDGDAYGVDNEEVRLARVLKEAAMEDKTVILTTLNSAWASTDSIIDLFLESFHIGIGTRWLLDHLVIVAFDKKAYLQCTVMHSHCFALKTMGIDFSGEKNFMSDGYLKMVWRRIDFLRIVLEMGYNFIFTDADVMWFRNPFPHFFPDGDFQIACDRFFGNYLDPNNIPNGGFNLVKSNNRTIEFYKFWYSSRYRHPGYHDQDVLNSIKFDPFVDEIGLKMRFLSTTFFGGICEPSRNFSLVCTMHANCCVGLSRKLNDLRLILEDWRRYMRLPPASKNSRLPFWRIPQNCSLAPLHQQIL